MLPKPLLVVLMVGVPLFGAGAVVSAVVDFWRLDLLHAWRDQAAVLALHVFGAILGSLVCWLVVKFLVNGMDRLF
jgi:hypothetical protein